LFCKKHWTHYQSVLFTEVLLSECAFKK